MLDRLDLQIEVPSLTSSELLEARCGEPSAAVRERVLAAREGQRARGWLNALIPTAALREVCALMGTRPETRLRVIGHADDQGTPASNHRLGASRAGAVAEWMVNCGVPPERLESFSYGDTHRECTETAEECRERNRRVVFELLPE